MTIMGVSDMEENLDLILISAFRYALGRRTYMPVVVADFIVKHLPETPTKLSTIIIREIDDAVDGGDAGDGCDVDTWLALKTACERELKKRSDVNEL